MTFIFGCTSTKESNSIPALDSVFPLYPPLSLRACQQPSNHQPPESLKPPLDLEPLPAISRLLRGLKKPAKNFFDLAITSPALCRPFDFRLLSRGDLDCKTRIYEPAIACRSFLIRLVLQLLMHLPTARTQLRPLFQLQSFFSPSLLASNQRCDAKS